MLVLMCCQNWHGQNLVVTSNNHYFEPKFESFLNPLSHCEVIEKKVYLFQGFKVTCYDSTGKNYEVNLLTILPKKIAQSVDSRYRYTYSIDKNILVVKNTNNLYIFDNSNNRFRFKKKIVLKHPSQDNVFVEAGVIYLYGVYNFHEKSLDKSFRSGYLSIDIESEEEKILEIPFEDLVLTHNSPNNFMDFDSQQFLMAEPFTYKIKLFNLNNQVEDSIVANDSSFTVSDKITEFRSLFDPKKVGEGPSDYFESMNQLLMQMDRIWLVYFIDKYTIFVRLTRNSLNRQGENKMRFFDHIWCKSANGWQLRQVRDLDKLFQSETVTSQNIWPLFVPGSKLIFSEMALHYLFWTSTESELPMATKDFYWPSHEKKPHLKLVKFNLK